MKRLLYLSTIFVLLSVALPACGASQPPQLGDFVWIDTDGDGIQDASETGLPGVDVYLYDGQDTLIAQTQSDSQGWYGFNDQPSGDYYLVFDLKAGYRFTMQDQGNDDQKDSDADPVTGVTATFTVEVAGTNGQWDAGFVPISPSGEKPTPSPTPTPTASPTPEPTASPTPKQVITIPASEDTFVITTKLDWVFGSDEIFFVWGEYSYVYLLFSLADIPAGTQIPYAKLHLQIHPNSTAQGLKVWIQMLDPDQVWTQATLNGNNAPIPDQDALYVHDLLLGGYSGEGSEDVLDVTTLVQYAIDHGYSVFDMVIGGGQGLGDERQVWYSSESGKGPVLEVDP